MKDDHSKIFVTDFDGTMTKLDFYDLATRDLPSVATRDYWKDYVQGRLTHFEALAQIFASIRAPDDALMEILSLMEFDSGAAAAIRRLDAAGWKVIIASAGSRWYIEKLLHQAGIGLNEVEIHANPGVYTPETGLVLTLPVDDPFYDHDVGIGKPAIVQDALAKAKRVVFAGDGRPDLASAKLVKDGNRYATGWLASRLRQDGIPFHTFHTWSDIADDLLTSTPRSPSESTP